jgi:Rrf2 family iron-sulfur cluster assembly transcriptional regulator
VQFSASIEYAIHGLVFLAAGGGMAPRGGVAGSGLAAHGGTAEATEAPAAALREAVLLGDIAGATRVPESYLRKVFQQLGRAGLVTSHRGVKGGFTLARDPRSITLKHVVEAIDGTLPFYTCVKEKRGCTLMDACPVSAAFAEARNKMAEVLDATSIQQLAGGLSPKASWLKVTECA